MHSLLLALLIAFPGEHIASLPTGRMLERGRWQINVVHRFGVPILAPGWTRDPLLALVAADDYNALDYGIGRRFSAGIGLSPSDRVADLHAAWAPFRFLRVYPMLSSHLYRPKLDSLWLALGLGVPWQYGNRLAVIGLPRVTTNASEIYLSLGLGAKLAVGESYRVGLETEPVIIGPDPRPDLAWNLTFEREAGWHNFVMSIGSTRSSVPPYLFKDGIVKLGDGGFRLGFNILRKL